MEREGRIVRRLRARRLRAMRRIGKDRTKMKHSDRYPKLQLRIGDDLLGKLEKEIDRSGMSTSEILKKALSEYFDRNENQK
ncbi:ribbon-helix-helix domain-containing protein [Desulfobacterota bacterium AH_259_B03_O07]|nr:ribbon-helix-helix domain-containing protein [Desulfobacterota bacterium AH_259_B03_O07]